MVSVSSLELAKMLGSTHYNMIRDIRRHVKRRVDTNEIPVSKYYSEFNYFNREIGDFSTYFRLTDDGMRLLADATRTHRSKIISTELEKRRAEDRTSKDLED